MGEITWYYPETVDEAVSMISNEGVIAHGGGMSILRGSMKRIRGLVELSHLPLRYHCHHGSSVELGACLTFAEAAEYLSQLDDGNVLAKALGSAATTPLRNRITLGGSLAIFPTWSDLMGPLVALQAKSIVGEIDINGPAPAIANALFDAVGVRMCELPLTPERVWKRMQEEGET